MKKYYSLLLLLFLLSTATVLSADNVVVLEDYSITSTSLNTTVLADQANWTGGNSTTYVLRKGGTYVWDVMVAMPATSDLSFQSDYGAGDPEVYPNQNLNPIIYLYNTVSPILNITADGVKLGFKNISISGYNENNPSSFSAESGTVLRAQTSGGSNTRIIFDSCIVKSVAAQVLRTEVTVGLIKFTHCIIADQGGPSSNFGAGKFIDARNIKVDTIWIENNTFVNFYDRIIRHYAAPAGQFIANFIFNHNTVLNSMSYHGFLSLGRVKDDAAGGDFQIRDNLFVDHFALGMDTAKVRQSEFGDPAENDRWGRARLAWVLTNKNDVVQWDIQKNYYAVSDSGQAMLDLPAEDPAYFGPKYQSCDLDSIGGDPADHNFLTRNMNKILNDQAKDTLNTFKKVTVYLNNTPRLMTEMIRWVMNGSMDAKNKPTLGTAPVWLDNGSPDMDRRLMGYYSDTLNCNYSCVEENLSAASTDGAIIGDKRWSPPRDVNDVVAQLPSKFALNQNYPNPFNPSTQIKYTIPTASKVTLKIYNLLGQVVATLVNERQEANTYVKEFDASRLSSGIYFYQINAGSFNATKKMILMK